MDGVFFSNVIVREGPLLIELFSSEDESLLVGWDALLVVDMLFERENGIGWLNVDGHGPSSESLHEYLHHCLFIMFLFLFLLNLKKSIILSVRFNKSISMYQSDKIIIFIQLKFHNFTFKNIFLLQSLT